LIIAIKSLIGFIGDIQVIEIDWIFLLIFALLSVVGIFIGVRLNQIVPGQKLK
ncbi:MAG TPA: permease, partial [Flavobacteriaceae bacterium]|nr:permease [Flavobacteriaceae bacterium]